MEILPMHKSLPKILYPFLSDYQKVYEINRAEIAYEGIRYYAGQFDSDGARGDTVCPHGIRQKLFEKAVCEKRQIKYPKYGHERINFFENELIRFLAS